MGCTLEISISVLRSLLTWLLILTLLDADLAVSDICADAEIALEFAGISDALDFEVADYCLVLFVAF